MPKLYDEPTVQTMVRMPESLREKLLEQMKPNEIPRYIIGLLQGEIDPKLPRIIRALNQCLLQLQKHPSALRVVQGKMKSELTEEDIQRFMEVVKLE